MRAIFFATLSWAQASALLVVACGPLVHCPAAGGVQTRPIVCDLWALVPLPTMLPMATPYVLELVPVHRDQGRYDLSFRQVAITNDRLTTVDHPHGRKLFQQYGHLCLYGLSDQGTCRSPKYAFDAQAKLSHTTLKNDTISHGVLLVAHWSAKPFVATVRHLAQVRCNPPVHHFRS